jgi:hypothetical protein
MLCSTSVRAQQPFYTDDADVAPRGQVHVECFNEHDWLPASQMPHLQQNTFNMKVNYGMGRGLELDIDGPIIAIVNDPSVIPQRPIGLGDLNFGLKYNVRQQRDGSSAPAFTLVSYVEVPTGDVATDLGSGLVDIWVYGVVQKTLPREFVVHMNGGYLFHGNTSTGTVGITTARGHVVTMGGSLVRKVSETVTLGVDVTAAATHNAALERAQLQVMLGGTYALGQRFSIDAGVIAGHYTASPRFGVQIGFSWDVVPGPPGSASRSRRVARHGAGHA